MALGSLFNFSGPSPQLPKDEMLRRQEEDRKAFIQRTVGEGPAPQPAAATAIGGLEGRQDIPAIAGGLSGSMIGRLFSAADNETREKLVDESKAQAQQAQKTSETIQKREADAKIADSLQYAQDPVVRHAIERGIENKLGASLGELRRPDAAGFSAAHHATRTLEDLNRMVSGDIESIDQKMSLLHKDPKEMTKEEKLGMGLVALMPVIFGALAGGKKGVQAGIVAMMASSGAFLSERDKSIRAAQE